ncbi:RNA ligase and tail fiber protein attachment catalyst [Burkholderia phage BcepSaruman]|uniref:RNA ligase and tail fiber attachment catalyst n=1 Tax=Burkholderia phage BcepSaruman TaxID=2530032 RepID=A0A4D5ZCL4_9CAUD|nr:RNA ligase and tail fiber protein attachment catalyst [Burkholderia phage BcepSaruman]QBX06783.1 RNA ligase and tail fiber attachment catalyst [Burkholderia phage BcepSaruman]
MFPTIKHINDLQPFVEGIEEIKFLKQPGQRTVVCYTFMDSHTFDTPKARECRGISFDINGNVESRPLHKFFNMGEKPWLMEDNIRRAGRAGAIVGIYNKIDGSMVNTSYSMASGFAYKSKKSYSSDTVLMFEKHVPVRIDEFSRRVAGMGYTATYEFTHPEAQIVVPHAVPDIKLLHIRDNTTGEYVMLNKQHMIWDLIHAHAVPYSVNLLPELSVDAAIDSLESMIDNEGFVFQFADGDMVKAKCPWYSSNHRAVSYMRERDIAVLVLNEQLDDLKGTLVKLGHDLGPVEEVEHRVKERMLQIDRDIEFLADIGRVLRASNPAGWKKAFAASHSKLEVFGLAVKRLEGRDEQIVKWYTRSKLKDEFGLRSLLNASQQEAMEG